VYREVPQIASASSAVSAPVATSVGTTVPLPAVSGTVGATSAARTLVIPSVVNVFAESGSGDSPPAGRPLRGARPSSGVLRSPLGSLRALSTAAAAARAPVTVSELREALSAQLSPPAAHRSLQVSWARVSVTLARKREACSLPHSTPPWGRPRRRPLLCTCLSPRGIQGAYSTDSRTSLAALHAAPAAGDSGGQGWAIRQPLPTSPVASVRPMTSGAMLLRSPVALVRHLPASDLPPLGGSGLTGACAGVLRAGHPQQPSPATASQVRCAVCGVQVCPWLRTCPRARVCVCMCM
jgi:hypothetical protein